ncbi:MAG TPA: hypothetical protein VFG86_08175, partial [Chloroflexota bacterium]|nr:hypothetical protein [Chloroflexota bacterium]
AAALVTSAISIYTTRHSTSRSAQAARESAERTAIATLDAAREAADRSAHAALEATRITTEANLEATKAGLAAAQAARLWEERSQLYVDIVAEVMQRQTIRALRLRNLNTERTLGEHLLKLSSLDDPRRYYTTVARVATLGSDLVFAAFETAREANEVVFRLDAEWKSAAEAAKENLDDPEATELGEEQLFGTRVQAALHAATDADIALIQCVRDELHGVPSPEASSAPAVEA